MSEVTLHLGDCLSVMRGMPSDSIDSICTDPPAGISFMQAAFDSDRGGRAQWVAWLAERMAEALRLTRPGCYALVWAIPRRSHWTATALEDAGWEIRDRVAHIQGQGFPKSKACLKPSVEDWWLCRKPGGGKVRELQIDACRVATAASDDYGRSTTKADGTLSLSRSPGYGLAEHPYSPNGAGRYPPNLLMSHSDRCRRVGTKRVKTGIHVGRNSVGKEKFTGAYSGGLPETGTDRGYAGPDGTELVESWECDDSCPVKALDDMAGERGAHGGPPQQRPVEQRENWRMGSSGGLPSRGTASRFFPVFSPDPDAPDFPLMTYQTKASRTDRGLGNTHPTTKSQLLMRWLTKLITPPGGTVLDPFLGSGTTALACLSECFNCIGIEAEAEYLEIARNRIAAVRSAYPLLGATQ